MSIRLCGQLGLLAGAVALLCGCDDLSEYRSGSDHVFRGQVVGSDNLADGKGSFIRQGFPSFTEMELTFDPAVAARAPEEDVPSPGMVDTTFPCPPDADDCEPGERVPGPLVAAALEPIPSLVNDALSQYDFPGGGRVRSYIFGTHFDGGQGDGELAVMRDALVFLSLMDDGRIEARVISNTVLPSGGGDPLQPPLFGVFRLERQAK